ncbi:16S rRNA (uracil(1498)-N(3))-methyltransferase [Alkalibacillus haloalkaliphilus]|uniref:16S rRNA (uracil(1498)-N(3))-methyltransferase n=1 Tax=Alkalibacillus haloalkaliphilus TaxID=94136 RepID=UPI0029364178|nr:16S rRNA (uracil(1498)-N(3))-methyltransferase [Alkalibacillus haloalkaliphilus]MDV2581034.1 16S rRNA (uracil(1498)-N(3))-methyltransferase [Alkalibacillus haloalkaliphilus]
MQRYFISEDLWNLEDKEVLILDEDFHHVVNVMRKKPGSHFICCHPSEQSYLVEITEINTDEQTVKCRIIEQLDENKELPVYVTLAQGLPKGDKLDLIVQKATELGIREFVPLKMDRSIVKWDDKKSKKKLQRLKKIAKEASEQSHRQSVPTITNLETVQSLLNRETFDKIIIASEYEAKGENHATESFPELITGIGANDRILVIIGPEGGISEAELQDSILKQAVPIRLGPRILRTETAPMYVLSILSFYLEEWR